MGNTALITGINGQDGSYLAEFLLEKDMKSGVRLNVIQYRKHNHLELSIYAH